jgi:formylglycine-generating enzyme required for sulfatase activity
MALAQLPAEPYSVPPGLVLIPGGRTRIGSTVKEIERLLSIDPNSENYAGALFAETPQHEFDVEAFLYGCTEVTNEQYALFVRASGAEPPFEWAQGAVARAAEEFLAGQARAREAASTQGLPLPEPASFDPRQWWSLNWKGQEWAIPPGDELRPVVFVRHDMVRDWLRWAGLRLPSEQEYQRAVRGDGDRRYPWGDAWDDERYAATVLQKRKGGPYPVGSFPQGSSRQGLHDLAGNVWEWTDSPYVAYPGYRARLLTFGYGAKLRQVSGLSAFDSEALVIVGGSFQNGNLVCRATTRRPTRADTTSEALGFRPARSLRPGVDLAREALATRLTPIWRPDGGKDPEYFQTAASVGLEQWWSAPSAAGAPPGYACIGGYRGVVFCPVKELPVHDRAALSRLEDEPLGFLHSTADLREPELAQGTHLVRWRKGRIVFTDLRGTERLALEGELEYANLREGSVTQSNGSWHLHAPIPCRTSGKAFFLSLELRPAE